MAFEEYCFFEESPGLVDLIYLEGFEEVLLAEVLVETRLEDLQVTLA